MANVILAEDDDLVRYALVRLMTEDGYAVHEARDGKEAEALLSKVSADILITDIIMPGQEGIETVISVRASHPDLPIIAISGGGRTQNIGHLDSARELGADKVLAKPFPDDVFLATIKELIASGRRPN